MDKNRGRSPSNKGKAAGRSPSPTSSAQSTAAATGNHVGNFRERPVVAPQTGTKLDFGTKPAVGLGGGATTASSVLFKPSRPIPIPTGAGSIAAGGVAGEGGATAESTVSGGDWSWVQEPPTAPASAATKRKRSTVANAHSPVAAPSALSQSPPLVRHTSDNDAENNVDETGSTASPANKKQILESSGGTRISAKVRPTGNNSPVQDAMVVTSSRSGSALAGTDASLSPAAHAAQRSPGPRRSPSKSPSRGISPATAMAHVAIHSGGQHGAARASSPPAAVIAAPPPVSSSVAKPVPVASPPPRTKASSPPREKAPTSPSPPPLHRPSPFSAFASSSSGSGNALAGSASVSGFGSGFGSSSGGFAALAQSSERPSFSDLLLASKKEAGSSPLSSAKDATKSTVRKPNNNNSSKQEDDHEAAASSDSEPSNASSPDDRKDASPIGLSGPLPPVATGEEDELTVFKCPQTVLKVLDSEEKKWKQKGAGPLHINVGVDTESGKIKARIIVRHRGSYALVMNAPLFADMSIRLVQERTLLVGAIEAGSIVTYALQVDSGDTAQHAKMILEQLKTPESAQEFLHVEGRWEELFRRFPQLLHAADSPDSTGSTNSGGVGEVAFGSSESDYQQQYYQQQEQQEDEERFYHNAENYDNHGIGGSGGTHFYDEYVPNNNHNINTNHSDNNNHSDNDNQEEAEEAEQ